MTEQQPGVGQDAEPGPVPRTRGWTAFRRSRDQKVIAGVCGGLGREFDVDPVVFRVVFAVLALSGGVGLLGYGVAWLLYPLDGEDENEGRRLLSGRVDGPGLTALLCTVVGCGLLLSMLDNGAVLAFSVLLSATVIGAAHWSQQRRRAAGSFDPSAAHAVADAPPETQAPPSPDGPSWWREPLTKDPGSGYLWGPDEDNSSGGGGRSRRVREARGIGGVTFLLALTAAVAGAVSRWDAGSVSLALQTGLACALAVFGLGLAVSAWFGRAGAGTIINVVLTGVLLAGAASLPRDLGTDWGHRTWAPTSAATVRDAYELDTGIGVLDLSRAAPGKHRTVGTRASVGAGRLEVKLPADATVRLTVDVDMGDIRLPGRTNVNPRVGAQQHRQIVLRPVGGEDPQGTLVLRLEAGAGQVEVTRERP